MYTIAHNGDGFYLRASDRSVAAYSIPQSLGVHYPTIEQAHAEQRRVNDRIAAAIRQELREMGGACLTREFLETPRWKETTAA